MATLARRRSPGGRHNRLPRRTLRRQHGGREGDVRHAKCREAAGRQAGASGARGPRDRRQVHPHGGRAQEPRPGLEARHAEHQGRTQPQGVDDRQHPGAHVGRADRQGRDHEDHLLPQAGRRAERRAAAQAEQAARQEHARRDGPEESRHWCQSALAGRLLPGSAGNPGSPPRLSA